MSLFAGMAAGWGEAQGQHNQKMLDFLNQKSQTMAQLYGHLADNIIQNGGDQDIASEFLNRAKGWASTNPILDPKGYQAIVKQEKSGIHDIVDGASKRQISNYHNQTFGGGQPQSTIPQAPPVGTNSAQAPTATLPAPQTGQTFDEGTAPQSLGPSTVGTAPIQTPTTQQQPTIGTPSSSTLNTPPMSIQDYVRSIVGPEPPKYGSLGQEPMDHKVWRDAYTKRLEGTVPTPSSMQGAMGSPFMPAGFASPYLSFMGREAQANSKLAGTGYKMVNGQINPMNPDEYSMAATLKMQKDQSTIELQQAAIPLRKAMVAYYGTKTQMIPEEMKLRLQELGVRLQHLRLSEEMTNARLFSVGPDGKPLPGSLVIDGVPISPMLSANVRPTNSTMGKAETAIPVIAQTEALSHFVTENPDLFGIVHGNFKEWLASGHNMTNDPREGELRASLLSLASLMVPLHGFRSQKAAEEFMGRLSQGMSPEGFIAALTAFNAVGKNIYENGMPNIVGGQGQVRPRLYNSSNTPTTPKYAVGGTFSKNGKKYKVTKLNSDGGVDAVEVP